MESGVMKPKPLVALKNFTVPVWAILGELLHPFRFSGPTSPEARRKGRQFRWRPAFAHD
jgi:hypothetical protein